MQGKPEVAIRINGSKDSGMYLVQVYIERLGPPKKDVLVKADGELSSYVVT